MRIDSPSRRTSSVAICAIVFLAFMVLGWGTGYKLSLYHLRGGPPSSIPVAKLLSQKERPSTSRVGEGVLPAAPNHRPIIDFPAIMIVALVSGMQFAVSPWMRAATMDEFGRQRWSYSNFFFFRPPPVLLFSN